MIFGKKYIGFVDYVFYWLMKIIEIEVEILEFFFLMYIFIDYCFLVNVLVGMFQIKVVILESVFINNDVIEFLSLLI